MQTYPAVEHGPRVRGISPIGKEKVYGGVDARPKLRLSLINRF